MLEGTVVLVVEDEPLIRMDVVDSLEAAGFVVLEAGNADAAIELLEARLDIALLFTDIDMPGSMDGLKLAAAVRDRWPPIRIIVASGQRAVEGHELPADSLFFPKPYDPGKVVSSMTSMLRLGDHPSRT